MTEAGNSSQFAPTQHVVTLSPDNSHVFSITTEGFDITNITTGLVTIRVLSDSINSTAGAYWAEDGFIYVNTLTQQTPTYTLSEDEINSLHDQLGSWDWDYSNQAHIYRLDSQTGEVTLIHEVDNIWAITRLNSLDGYLYWAELPDGTEVINDFRAGVFSTDYDRYTLIDNYLLPHIYRMPLAGRAVELVAEDLQRFIPISSN